MHWTNLLNFGRGRPMSLAARLTLTYALGTGLLVMGAGGLMYYQLVASLRHENAAYLNEEIHEVRADLRQPMAVASAIRQTIESDTPDPTDAFPTYVRVLEMNGAKVAQTPGMPDWLTPAVYPKPPQDEDAQSEWMTVRAPDSSRRGFQILSAEGEGWSAHPYMIELALDLTEEDKLLAQYRGRIYSIIVPTLLASALAGYVLARGGLRPLRQVVRAVRRIESTTLDQRIDSEGFPNELVKLAGSFNDMLHRMEDAFERLSRFSADIAHELRTPLGCIRGEMEVALGKARTPDEYREVLGSCLEECVRLSHLIDRLLFLARADRDETVLKLETVTLDRELANVREFYEPGAADAGISLTVEAQSSLQPRLDRTLFQSALGNLIENAIAHTPRGGTVKLTAARNNGTYDVTVADTGCGIAADHLPFVLDRFYRVDTARGRQGGHLGLGLAIVNSIATLHGGRLLVESRVGQGTSVTLSFPA